MNTSSLSPSLRKTILWASSGFALLVLVLFAWIYHFDPFPDPGLNDQMTYLFYLGGAVVAAMSGTLLTRQFEKGEPPRRVWLMFTLGWWAWAVGEFTDIVYEFFYPQGYPEFTLIDACWVLGYVFFGLSIYYQFRLIYGRHKRTSPLFNISIIAAILLITAGFTQLAIEQGLGEKWSWPGVYLAVFYPVCDSLQGMAALWLALLFRSGRWGRPWWALLCFAVADAIATWFWIGGGSSLPVQTSNLLYLFADSIYLGGYLLVAIAFLSNYLVFKLPIEKGT
ncbi:MAG: hypothetical protein ABWK53_02160 [Anaerolineales bacterium]